MLVTKEKIERAFTQWDINYRNNPEEFMSDVENLLRNTPYSYGKACQAYFLKLLKEV